MNVPHPSYQLTLYDIMVQYNRSSNCAVARVATAAVAPVRCASPSRADWQKCLSPCTRKNCNYCALCILM